MTLGMEMGLGPGHIVLDDDPVPPKNGHSPQFSAHVYCGQTAGWIKVPLGMEVGLSLGDIVLDGNPAPASLKGHSSQFSARVRCGQTARWTNIGTQLYRKKGTPTQFWPMSIVSKRLD